jgi:hypothetical protein
MKERKYWIRLKTAIQHICDMISRFSKYEHQITTGNADLIPYS